MDIKNRKRTVFRAMALLLAAVLTLGLLPAPARAATSAEIQEEIDALERKNAAIQAEIDALRRQYDTRYEDMAAMVAQKDAIDQEMTLLNEKIEATNSQIRQEVPLALNCSQRDGPSLSLTPLKGK